MYSESNKDHVQIIDNDANSLAEASSTIHPSHSLPVLPLSQDGPILQDASSVNEEIRGIQPSSSFSSTTGIYPYTCENKPKRRPFYHGSSTSVHTEVDSHLYTRFRYYSRLRAAAESHEHALIIPDHIVPAELFFFYIPGQVTRDAEGKQASYVTILSIWNTMMGTSLLTMPWAFGQAGFICGIVIMLVQAAICLYTAIKLLQLQRTMGMEGEMHELNFLFRSLWSGNMGKVIEGTAVTFSVITILGALIVYWVLMSNFLFNTGEILYQLSGFGLVDGENFYLGVTCPPNITHFTFNTTLINGQEDWFHKIWKQDLSVPLFLLIPFVFLLSIKNTSIFTYFNSLGAVSVIAIYMFVVVQATHWGFNFNLTDVADPMFIPSYKSTFMALSGTLSLAYFIHNCVITILKGNKNPENNVRDLSIAYFLVAATYIPVALIFYLSFPLPKFCIVSNFLDNFPPHNKTLAVARVFLLFQMLTVYPLLTYFLRTQLLVYLFGPNFVPNWKHVLPINLSILTFSVCVAIFYPNIGVIIRWVGALAGLAYIFILPSISDFQAHYKKGTLRCGRCFGCFLIMSLGIANFVAQFFS